MWLLKEFIIILLRSVDWKYINDDTLTSFHKMIPIPIQRQLLQTVQNKSLRPYICTYMQFVSDKLSNSPIWPCQRNKIAMKGRCHRIELAVHIQSMAAKWPTECSLWRLLMHSARIHHYLWPSVIISTTYLTS